MKVSPEVKAAALRCACDIILEQVRQKKINGGWDAQTLTLYKALINEIKMDPDLH